MAFTLSLSLSPTLSPTTHPQAPFEDELKTHLIMAKDCSKVKRLHFYRISFPLFSEDGKKTLETKTFKSFPLVLNFAGFFFSSFFVFIYNSIFIYYMARIHTHFYTHFHTYLFHCCMTSWKCFIFVSCHFAWMVPGNGNGSGARHSGVAK